jgi:hypothetical protein
VDNNMTTLPYDGNKLSYSVTLALFVFRKCTNPDNESRR